MSRNQIRAVLPGVYVIAILVAVFSHHGLVPVAAIGAVALGMAMRLLHSEPGQGRDRSARYRRRYGRGQGDDLQDR